MAPEFKSKRISALVEELFTAIKRLRQLIIAECELGFGFADLDKVELSARREMEILYKHLKTMAMEDLKRRGIADWIISSIEDVAHDAIADHIFRMRSDGGFGLFRCVQDLYNKYPDPSALEAFYYFRVIVKRGVSKKLVEFRRDANPKLQRVYDDIDSLLLKSGRYKKIGSYVANIRAIEKPTHARFPTSEEILAFCGSIAGRPRDAASMLDMIFSELDLQQSYKSSVHLSELRRAMYELSMTLEIPISKDREEPSPDQAVEQAGLWLIVQRAVDRVRNEYGWKDVHTEEVRMAYCNTALSYYQDLCRHRKPQSLRKYLEAHLPINGDEGYREHKGSIQHFMKILREEIKKHAT